MLAADRNEQPDGPHVGQRHLQFDFWFAIPLRTLEAAVQPFHCSLGGSPFPGIAGPPEQFFHLGKFRPEGITIEHGNHQSDRRISGIITGPGLKPRHFREARNTTLLLRTTEGARDPCKDMTLSTARWFATRSAVELTEEEFKQLRLMNGLHL